ncbi:hypothetical protein PC119_g4745 [Phytophthora cactorum]|uniref:Uncharacterized protein n=1 Tax=Phytophthora cactorum TaxID=29920 RepID=A0A8T1EE39_9STRA|nr:hypothetical protein PC117_g4915 [Phytophthora cactorum]KAG3034939.1 hypothetical protein PC119_g4745 [Phytophthora cactorum]
MGISLEAQTEFWTSANAPGGRHGRKAKELRAKVLKKPDIDLSTTSRQGEMESERELQFLAPQDGRLSQQKTADMQLSRPKYYEFFCKDHQLRIHISYNGGSLVGWIQSTIASIVSAIVVANLKEKPQSADEAVDAVGHRVANVFGCIFGVTLIEPDPKFDQPDP